MRLNLPQKGQGHRFENIPNNDLDQKLTYQQLLNLNHDLSKENLILKNQTRRLGDQLRNLHSHFQIKTREQNAQLYQAIGVHPTLHQYESTLIPLLDAYENKIQNFQHDFETVHQQFFALEKRFQEVCKENQELRLKLTQKTKELIDVYRNGGNEKMQSDFGQIILAQINEKQKALVQQNARLQRDYQKFKAQSERAKTELEQVTQRLDQSKSKIRQLQLNVKGLQAQNSSLKDSSFQLQIKANQAQAERRKLQQAHERAQSQNNQLNKQRDMYKNRLDELKIRIQRDTSIPVENDQGKLIQQLRTQIAFLEAQKGPNDTYKKLTSLQNNYDALVKQKGRLKETIALSKNTQNALNATIAQLKTQISQLRPHKQNGQKIQNKTKQTINQLTTKSKNDMLRIQKQHRNEIQSLQNQFKQKLQLKDRKIAELTQSIDKVNLERQRLQRLNQLNGHDQKPKTTKDNQRALNKIKQKMAISEQLFKQQIEIFQKDLSYMRKQADGYKSDLKQKTEQLRILKTKYQQLTKQYEQVSKQKQTLVQQFRNIRDQYQTYLKQRERLFEQKIREIRAVVQETENKRKSQRDKVQQATKQYRKVLDDIRNAYEARIRELENQVTQVQYIKTEITPGRFA